MADLKKLIEAAAAAPAPSDDQMSVATAMRAALKGIESSRMTSTSEALANAVRAATAGLGDLGATYRAADLLQSTTMSQLIGASAALRQFEDSHASRMAGVASQIANLTKSLSSDRWHGLSSGALAGLGSIDRLVGPDIAALGKAQSFAASLHADIQFASHLPPPVYQPESFFPRYEVPAEPEPSRPMSVHVSADPRCFNAGESDEIVRWLRGWVADHDDGPVRCGCFRQTEEYDLRAYRVSVPLRTRDPDDDLAMDRVTFVCGTCDQLRDYVAWPELKEFRQQPSLLDGEAGGDGAPQGNLRALSSDQDED